MSLRLLRKMPAHVINGIGVSIGIALAQVIVHAVGGMSAALVAASGAVYASLADQPNPPRRGWRRVLLSGAIGCFVCLIVSAVDDYPAVLAIAVGLIGAASTMALAWGARAGPMSFVGILGFVFTMAMPPSDLAGALQYTAMSAVGALIYLAWSVLYAMLMQRRYRALALVSAVEATAGLLRSRAALLVEAPETAEHAQHLKRWIADESALDERLQWARDMLFGAAETDRTAQLQTALLLRTIDLRETLLLGELNHDLLGRDEMGMRVRAAMAGMLVHAAEQLESLANAWRYAEAWSASTSASPPGIPQDLSFPADDSRSRILQVVRDRARHLIDDLNRMRALMQGEPVHVPLSRAELQVFMSAQDFPMAALKRNLTLRSPIARHAIRLGAALSCAYVIALALPWTSHPYWLVLSVAVVLRGTLDQTLSRRNARVLGTIAGCLVVLAIVHTRVAALAGIVFLMSAGTAHAFVMSRYGVTATAATVMALLQAHMAHGLSNFTFAERIADTVLGALLAWGFSYVLPSWERHGVSRLVTRLQEALCSLAATALQLHPDESATVQMRLARREAYEALGGLAAAALRGHAEPSRVRLEVDHFAALHRDGHALLAQLAAVKLLLTRRGPEMDPIETTRALEETRPAIKRLLEPRPTRSATPSSAPAIALDEDDQPSSEQAAAHASRRALGMWLQRRLRMTMGAAARVARSAAALRRAAGS